MHESGKQGSLRASRLHRVRQALFFKEGQGSEKCSLRRRHMPGGRDSQGEPGRSRLLREVVSTSRPE